MIDVSFIVPAFNEERLLGRTLQGISRAISAIPESCEVLVVDDASSDDTASIAAGGGARVIPVRFRHIAATRNAGARAAQGRWLIFVDADTLVTEDVVRASIVALRAGVAGGGCDLKFEGPLPAYGRLLIAIALPIYKALRLAAGCYLFCSREAFDAVGGFDETVFAAEEVFLSRQLRKQGRFLVLPEQVLTSGRKLRSHSGREVFGMLRRVAWGGRKALERRDGLDIWYGARRKD